MNFYLSMSFYLYSWVPICLLSFYLILISDMKWVTVCSLFVVKKYWDKTGALITSIPAPCPHSSLHPSELTFYLPSQRIQTTPHNSTTVTLTVHSQCPSEHTHNGLTASSSCPSQFIHIAPQRSWYIHGFSLCLFRCQESSWITWQITKEWVGFN